MRSLMIHVRYEIQRHWQKLMNLKTFNFFLHCRTIRHMEDFKFLCHLLSLPISVVQWIKLQSNNLELKVLRLKVIFCKISDFHLNASAMTSRFRNNLFVSICLLILSFSFFVAVVIARYMCNNVFEHKYLVPLCVICINTLIPFYVLLQALTDNYFHCSRSTSYGFFNLFMFVGTYLVHQIF